jgi:hypothetical protein
MNDAYPQEERCKTLYNKNLTVFSYFKSYIIDNKQLTEQTLSNCIFIILLKTEVQSIAFCSGNRDL